MEGLIKNVLGSDGWKGLMKVSRLRHNYSMGNSLLIYWTYRSRGVMPSVCMSKSAWEKAGRELKPRAKGVMILAPRFKKIEDENGEVIGERTYFASGDQVRTYDVSETTGPPIVGITTPSGGVTGPEEAIEAMTNDLAAVAETMGYKVVIKGDNELLGGELGHLDWQNKEIVMRDSLTPAERAHCLAHELGHANDRQLMRDPSKYHEQRPDAEFVAEATAWDICERYGINSDDFASEYIAGWKFRNYNPERVKMAKNVLERWWEASSNLSDKLNEVTALPVAA